MADLENLTFHEADTRQYEKFDEINSMSDEQWTLKCVSCNDCSICDMAIHQHLISTDKHICVYGMSRKAFETVMSNADCDF